MLNKILRVFSDKKIEEFINAIKTLVQRVEELVRLLKEIITQLQKK